MHLGRGFKLTVIGWLIAIPLIAQVGNEWIDTNQAYYKIRVGKDGLYRLTYANLLAAGVSPAIDPRKFQLYHRGQRQPMLVQGEQDGQLNSGDYIEFYGQHNTGTSDTELYQPASYQPHTLYNIYSDTSSYFLTLSDATPLRITSASGEGTSSLATWHFDEKLLVLKEEYSGGLSDEQGEILQSIFDQGEGWTGRQVNGGQSLSYVVDDIHNTVQTAGQPTIEILLTGRSAGTHATEVYAGSRLLASTGINGYSSVKVTQPLQWSDVSADGKVSVMLKVNAGHASIGYARVVYPQTFDMAQAVEKYFTLPENPSVSTSIQIANAPPGTRLFDITDPGQVKLISTTQTTTLNVLFDPSVARRKLYATSAPLTPPLKRAEFRQLTPGSYSYVIVTHPSLRKPVAGYTDPVKAYAEYRALPQGGGFDTLVVNIDQLYDQFNYGEQSPLGIYHFLKYLGTVKLPAYLFLVGKGLEANWNYYRAPGNFPVYRDLVPTAGYPASDMLYSAGLTGLPHVAAVSTGRLSATDASMVAAYLNKVKETESLPYNDLRRKNILHLSGGIYEGEPETYRSYLEDYASIAVQPYLGGQVKAIAKQTTSLKTINVSDELNKGLGLITFFGHSSTTSTDFDIGNVTDPVMNYHNPPGVYPVIVMNGCLAGSFFLNGSIFGENWVNTGNRGAIGFIAHSYFGFNYSLRQYSDLFYQIGFGDSLFMGKGLGDIQRELARRYMNSYGDAPSEIVQVQEMVLLGDPAVKLFGAEKPDYEIQEGNVLLASSDGEPITALSDSFKLSMVIRNFGVAPKKDLQVSVTRTLADGNSYTYTKTFRHVLYSDTVYMVLPVESANGFGINTFNIKIDADDRFDELREDNNTVTYAYFIPVSRAKNVFPSDFAIVSNKQVRLSLQHTDMLSGEREFILEVDTTNSFSSAYRQQFHVKGYVLASQNVTLLDTDSTVYYWRSRLADSLANESMAWDVRSFTYIRDGKEGWAQIKFPQYDDNALRGLVNDPELKRLEFLETTTDVAIRTFSAAAGKPVDSVSVKIDGTEYNIYTDAGGSFGCRNNTINLVAFDKTTASPYLGRFFTFPEVQALGTRLMCGREPYVINTYLASELTMGHDADIITYIDNVHAGDSVILFSIGDAGYSTWPAAARQKLQELGISDNQLTALIDGDGIVIFARKGAAPGSAKFFVTPAAEKRVDIQKTVTGRFSSGSMRSALIGPAQHWESLELQYTEAGPTDDVIFEVSGVGLNGEEETIMSGITQRTDLSSVDPKIYPYLRISFEPKDDALLTAAQLRHWLVLYEPVAEGMLLYKGNLEPQELPEGQNWNGQYTFVNIGNKSFADSLVVNYNFTNPETFVATKEQMKIAAPAPADTAHFTVSFGTVKHEGWNDIEVFVNPRIISEQSFDNNRILLNHSVNVIPDHVAPVLDVTIDGRHVQQDEFVSSSPSIHIMLWDNNPFLLKQDTTGVNIFMAYPCAQETCDFQPVYFSGANVSWEPETATSAFTVDYKPQPLADGAYILRIDAKDAHGNSSGSDPYLIRFQVKNADSVVVESPYPNPFDYKTHFNVMLTGNELPTAFSLQIISLKGELVQTFSEHDIAGFHVGNNTFSWNGQDMHGASLPNGIYFYRITVQTQGRVVRQNGKVVLAR